MAGAGVDLATGVAADPPSRGPFAGILDYATAARLQGLLLLLAVFLTCGLTRMQGDTWWQLRAGEDMWASGRVLLSDVYSHTAAGAFWTNHEWLAEVIFYACHRLGGLPLLTLFAAALITGGWLFSWRLTRGSSTPAFVLTLVALATSAVWWEPRPHAFSLLFLPWMVFLLHRGAIAWIVPLFLVWANTHGGVLLGFVLLGAGLTAQTLVMPSLWRRSVAGLAGAALAMTATPMGIDFWIEIPKSLSRISLYTLDEWTRTELTDPTMLPFWGIAAMYVWEAVRQVSRAKRLSPSEAAVHAVALVLLPGAIAAVRNVPPFLLVAVPALTALWAAEARPERPARAPDRRTAGLILAVMVCACLGVAVTLGLAYRDQWPRLQWNPIPEAALDALRGCPDNLYNRYDEGGMLLWFAPGRKVFLDGRQDPFPPALVLEHIEMETGRRPYGPTFERHAIRCAFLPVVSPVGPQLTRDGWTALYRDEQWVVLTAR